MKAKITFLLFICFVFLTACGGVTPYPTPLGVSPTYVLTSVVPFSTKDIASTITPTSWYTPTPETLSGYPTPEVVVWPTCTPGMDCLPLTPNAQRQEFTFHELYVGKYVLRNWCNIDPRFAFWSPCAITISSKDSKQIEIRGYPAELGEMTGADLTGRGKPNIVIIGWSDGNCCVRAIVYEAGDSLNKILEVGSHWLGTFTDLNGDGTYEYVVKDRVWSKFCNYCAVWPTVVYEYQPDKSGYVLATHKFKPVLSTDINEASDLLDHFTEQNPNIPLYFATDTDSEKKYWQYAKGNSDYEGAVNAVYRLTVYYLIVGQQGDAQDVLNKYFPPDQADEYMIGIQKDLQRFLAP